MASRGLAPLDLWAWEQRQEDLSDTAAQVLRRIKAPVFRARDLPTRKGESPDVLEGCAGSS